MNKSYGQKLHWRLLLVWLGVLGLAQGAVAQSGPVGNEWIVPSQQYYRIKIVRNGLYKLNYQYLTQAGIAGVAPSQLQLWRRGREVAIYVGGNTAVLDPSTFVEFYGIRNDGKLDGDLYKNPDDQAHDLYSFYTDTASYFLTWSTGAAARPGRRMSQPVTAGGTPHAYRLLNQLNLKTDHLNDRPQTPSAYLPWVEPAEGYFSGASVLANVAGLPGLNFTSDSVLRNVPTTGPAPRVEVLLVGGSAIQHTAQVSVVPPTGPVRLLGTMTFPDRRRARQSFQLQRSDISNAGRVTLRFQTPTAAAALGDYFFVGYYRIIAPQLNRWFPNRNSVHFENDSLLGGPATYELDSIPATVAGFDVQDLYNVQRIMGTPGTGQKRSFVFPAANATATRTLLLADEARLAVPPLPARLVRFRAINPAVPTFIIITHNQLMKPAAGEPNAAKAYANYRASAAGGRYDTLLLTTTQLYDQFQYGDRSWLAMRRFARWLAAASPAGANRYLLLLGRGIVPSEGGNRFDVIPTANTTRGPAGERGIDLVPTNSRSVSDNLLTADFANNDYAAQIPTGRLAATTPLQVMNYLNKLREYDAAGDQPWRKNVLHLTGGQSLPEFARFRGYMDKYKQRVERPYFGGTVRTYSRTTVGLGVGVVRINISTELNEGLSVISYFGHGSGTEYDLNLGNVSDPVNNYNNKGKYPILMYNGCAAGHLYTTTATFFDNWLFTPEKGAIGGMGQYGLSYEYLLDPMQDSLYKVLFNDPAWYGKSVPAVIAEVVRRLQRSSAASSPFGDATNANAIEQMLSTIWHGDPAISIYAPAKPDFIASNATLSIAPAAGQTRVTASSASFILHVGVSNPAKITFDSVEVRVTRQYPSASGRPNDVYTERLRFRQAWRQDTTYALVIPNTIVAGVNVFGSNQFTVALDYRNRVSELNEGNNTAQINYTFLQGGLTILNPTEFAIVPTARPRLIAQTNDPNGPQRTYEFELDTVPTFNSPATLQRTTVTTNLTPSWRPMLPTLPGRDSVVWYWRVRFQTPTAEEDGNWVLSSFRVIPGRVGWSQSHYAQLQRTTRTGVEIAAPTGRWSFGQQAKPMLLRTQGGGVPGTPFNFLAGIGYGIYEDLSLGVYNQNCHVQVPNMMIAVYDQHTLKSKVVTGVFDVCGQAPVVFYRFGTAGDTLNNLNNGSGYRQTQLEIFLNTIQDGDYVAIISMNRLRYAAFSPSLKNKLATVLGSRLINQLRNGDPFALLAQKNSAGGRLIAEKGPDLTSATPRYNQVITLQDTLYIPRVRGQVVSTRIGPAQEWQTLHHWITKETPTGQYTLRVLGVDNQGATTVLFPNVTTSRLDLTTTMAQRYPYLQLDLLLQDTVSRVPPQLKEWFITYRGVPEGIVRRDLAAATAYDPARLAQQAADPGTVTFPVVFENVTPIDFGTPLRARVEVRDAASPFALRRTVYATAPTQLKGDTTVTIPVSIPFIGQFGDFTTTVVVNPLPNAPAEPQALPELYHFNNELKLPAFQVIDKNVPPTLDVAFDGRRILNGELVSPTPVINIQLRDEDKLRHIRDRSYFTVLLKRPGQANFTTIDLNTADVSFTVDSTAGSVAKLDFSPGKATPLADGVYTLQVQARDPSRADAGTGGTGNSQPYEIRFEVVNASTITNVFPYPNPVTSKARFVFTVTGQELPRNMKIQIMTLTGRVVREIFMAELGPLHIGNNLTDYAWDGTDQFGDRLANGTYLYRVSLDDPNGQFSQRHTNADQAFKNDWGKLVLLR